MEVHFILILFERRCCNPIMGTWGEGGGQLPTAAEFWDEGRLLIVRHASWHLQCSACISAHSCCTHVQQFYDIAGISDKTGKRPGQEAVAIMRARSTLPRSLPIAKTVGTTQLLASMPDGARDVHELRMYMTFVADCKACVSQTGKDVNDSQSPG